MNQDLSILQSRRRTKLIFGLQLFLYNLLVLLVGLIVYLKLSYLGIVVETIASPDSLLNTAYIFLSVLVFTGIILLIIKFFRKTPIIKILEILFSFVTITLFISLFFNDLISLALALILIIIKEVWQNYIYRNLLTSIMVGFVGGYIAYSLDLLPIIALIVLVGVYDYIAVFKTKHMLALAENVVDRNMSFTYELYSGARPNRTLTTPITKNSQKGTVRNKLNLGTGDFAIPLIAIIEFMSINLGLGIFCFLLTNFALIFTIMYLLDNPKHRGLPALPLQAITLVVCYLISLVL